MNDHKSGMGRGSSAEARVLTTFLNEMDGIDTASSSSLIDGVLLLAATNRPSMLDRALLRPGRFDKRIHVPPPDEQGRRSILQLETASWPVLGALDLDQLASPEVSAHMTGAELVGACREAAQQAFRQASQQEHLVQVQHKHLEETMGCSCRIRTCVPCMEKDFGRIEAVICNEDVDSLVATTFYNYISI